MDYTVEERTNIAKCIAQWEKIKKMDPEDYCWNIDSMKHAAIDEGGIENDCYLCKLFLYYNVETKRAACNKDKCPLWNKKEDNTCDSSTSAPFYKLWQPKPQNKPHFKLYCQQIIDKCRRALE